jgi:hypothetical protein
MSHEILAIRDLAVGMAPFAPPRSVQVFSDGQQSYQVQGWAWRDLVGMRFHDGVLEKRASLRQFKEEDDAVNITECPMGYGEDSTVVETPMYIWQIAYSPVTATKQVNTIVVTNTDIYHYKGGSWTVRTPRYRPHDVAAGDYYDTTGTISFTASSTSVSGTSTNWADHFIAAGQMIGLDEGGVNAGDEADLTWYEIASVGGNGSITLTSAAGATQSLQKYVIRRTFNPEDSRGGPASNLFAKIFNGDLYVAGTSVGGQYQPAVIKVTELVDDTATEYLLATVDLDGTMTTSSVVSGIASINGMEVIQTGHILLATEEDTGRLSRVRHCSPVDDTEWVADPAGFTDVVAGGIRESTALQAFGDQVILHYADAMVVGQVTGQDDPPVSWPASVSDIGCTMARTLKIMGGQLYFLGNDGVIYRFNGGVPTPHTSDFRDFLRDAEFHQEAHSFFATIDRRHREYQLHDGAGNMYCVTEGGEPRREVMPRPILAASDQLMAAPGHPTFPYEPAATRDWGIRVVGFSVTHGGTVTGPLAVLRERMGTDHAAYSSSYTADLEAVSHDIDFGKPGRLKRIHEVKLWVRQHEDDNSGETQDVIKVGISVDGGITYDEEISETITYVSGETQIVTYVFAGEISAEAFTFRIRTDDNEKLVGQMYMMTVTFEVLGLESLCV